MLAPSLLLMGMGLLLSSVGARLQVYFLHWCRERQQCNPGSKSYQVAAKYWRTQLASPPGLLQLPLDYARPTEMVLAAHAVAASHMSLFTVGSDHVAQLKALAASLSASLYSVFVALFRLLLCRYSGTDDVLICTTYVQLGVLGSLVESHATDLYGTPQYAAGTRPGQLALRTWWATSSRNCCCARHCLRATVLLTSSAARWRL